MKNSIAMVIIFLSYITLLIYKWSEIINFGPAEAGILVGYVGFTSIIAGIMTGIIAPYSSKGVAKYIGLIFGSLGIIATILVLIFGDPLWEETEWIGFKIALSFVMLLVGFLSSLFVTAGCLSFGAWFGCKVGRKYQNDYAKEEVEEKKRSQKYGDNPLKTNKNVIVSKTEI